jgi:tetratricopeptide (TPR) repeat protein
MRTDRYGNTITTASDTARDAYVRGVDLLLSANDGADVAFREAIAADAAFALAHAALARSCQVAGKGADAGAAIDRAAELSIGLTDRERAHVTILEHLIKGRGGEAYKGVLAHVEEHPRDAVIVQLCAGVFGLIGFSGLAGREAEQLAFMHRLAPHYGDDWWFLSVYAFAQIEVGQRTAATATIERSLAANPRNAHGAHIRAHIYYEGGEAAAGLGYLEDWRAAYEKTAPLHCHISWHAAIWSLEQGHADRAFDIFEHDVLPGGAWGPPINVMTDAASFLMRAELAGAPVRDDLWQRVSDYASACFPNPGIAFADAHAALAHAMAGNGEALRRVITDAKGPAGDVVRSVGTAFEAAADARWDEVVAELTPVMADHERLGGSRAQRDLLEFTLANALLKSGRAEDARWLIQMRRPIHRTAHVIDGL